MFEQDKTGYITYHQFARIRKHDKCKLVHRQEINEAYLRYEVIPIAWYEKYRQMYVNHNKVYQIWQGNTKAIIVYF